MTHAGRAYEAPTSARLMDESGSSSLLGTPSAHPRTHSPRDVDHGIQLANQVAELLPTPQAADGSGGRIDSQETVLSGKRPSGAKASVSLREALTYKLLPTPDSSGAARNTNPTSAFFSLAQEVAGLLPTPRATRGGSATETARLLPTPKATNNDNRQSLDRYGPNLGMVLRGEPTSPSSDDGNDSPAPHRGQLTIGDD